MNDKRGKNTTASVRDRLLVLARERGEDFQLLLTRYGLERLLYRLGKSGYRDRFILKGAMLFMLWNAGQCITDPVKSHARQFTRCHVYQR